MRYALQTRKYVASVIALGLVLGSIFFNNGNSVSAAETLGPNLISNNSFETADGSGNPTGWGKGRWGTNTAVFSYPTAGLSGARSAKVELVSRTTGDAKWFFSHVPVTSGSQYIFRDVYTSTVTTHVTVEFRKSDGTFSYFDLGQSPASSNARAQEFRFTVPSGATSLTVYHLIKQVGQLTTDAYELRKIDQTTPPPPPNPDNLVPNPSLESTDANGNPTSWNKGRWGSNTALFIYPTAGQSGAKAARIEMSNRTSGDAKWYFNSIPVTGGSAFFFSEFYKSNVETFVTVQVQHANGSITYQDIAQLPASSSFRNFEAAFMVPNSAARITIFHVINKNGFLEVDNYLLERTDDTNQSSFTNGFVSIVFDDGWLDTYHNTHPLLNQRGIDSTNYIITERLSTNFPGYVKPADLQAMSSNGHEIGNHTRTHRDLTTLSSAEIQNEINGARSDLLQYVSPVNTVAYPFGSFNQTIKNIVGQNHIGARGTDGGFNLISEDKYALVRHSVESPTTQATINGWIDAAVRDKTWLILVFHRVDNSATQYTVPVSKFTDTLNYIQSKNAETTTVREGIGRLNN